MLTDAAMEAGAWTRIARSCAATSEQRGRADRLRPAPSGRQADLDLAGRGHRQPAGKCPHEQAQADALVTPRRPSCASGQGRGTGWAIWPPSNPARGVAPQVFDTLISKAIDTLFYNADDYGERYSAQDTLRHQGAAYVTRGTRLISNEGRVMLRITADDCGRHDTSAGACSCESNSVRFGHGTRFLHACRDNFCLELSRHGMTKRDIVPNLNFFMNVPIAPNGDLVVDDGMSATGSVVEMVAEMDILCIVSNCPQVNNPCNGYHPTPVQVQVFPATAS